MLYNTYRALAVSNVTTRRCALRLTRLNVLPQHNYSYVHDDAGLPALATCLCHSTPLCHFLTTMDVVPRLVASYSGHLR